MSEEKAKKEQEIETTTTVVGDWRIVHQKAPNGDERTFMNQRGIDGNNKQQIFQIGFQFAKDKKETIVELLVPLGMDLTQEICLGTDDDNKATATYKSCFTEGCLATATIPAKLLKQFNSNERGFLQFTHMQGGLAKIPFSLKGFEQAYKKLKSA